MSSRPGEPLLLLVGTLAACLFIVGLALDLPDLRLAVKTLPALALAAWVWPRGEVCIAAGLFFGALGDLALALPGGFLAGMVAFAIGHGLYVWAFVRWQTTPALLLAAPVAAYLAVALSLMAHGLGDMTVPVSIYMGIIGAMIWRAAVVADDHSTDGAARWSALIGALLFGFSDTLIGINRFAQPIDGAAYAIIVTYWAGQYFIARAAIARGAGLANTASR